MTPLKKIITHDGVFHADDVFAVAILRLIHPAVPVVRTRDRALIQSAMGTSGTYLLDIGGACYPEMGLYDHHQPEGAGFREQEGHSHEWPYATAGLIWKHFGAEVVAILHPALTLDGVAETVRHLDEALIKYIDAVDCGVRLKSSGPSLSALIASFNPSWYEPQEDSFPLVIELAQVVLTNFIKRYAGKVLARDTVRQSATRLNGRVLILETCLPWAEVVSNEMPDVLFVAYPVDSMGRQQWQLRATDQALGVPRIQFPADWAGREHRALANVTGVESAVFCHRSRHLAGATTLEDALSLALVAISRNTSANLPLAA